jgi:hypothetical protein
MKATLKKHILIGIFSVAALLLLAAGVYFLYFKAQFSVYQDDEYKFSIKYPKTWKVVIHPEPNVAVLFLRPKDTAMDKMQEDFNVTVQPLPEDILTLAAFSAAVKRQTTGVFKKSKLVEDKPLQWGWRQGHQMVLEDDPKSGIDHFALVNAWVLRSNQAYILTFLGDTDKYPQDKPLINEMISSLKLQ